MTTTIHKFNLEFGRTFLQMPVCSQMLTVQMQGEHPMLWAMVHTHRPLQQVVIDVYGAGFDMPDQPGLYIATFQDGPMVWHAFEAVPHA